jgi:mono/diheme cytochrome c family protein
LEYTKLHICAVRSYYQFRLSKGLDIRQQQNNGGIPVMKKLFKPVLFLTLAVFITTAAMAAEGGNPRKGKHLYKKTCKACHSSGGEGGEVTPMTKTQAQWDRVFDKKKHNEDAWKGVSEQDLKDIQQFLFDHAADSPQPQTCG